MDDALSGALKSAPNWDAFPNLENVVTPADIVSKGNGNFKAHYIPWMKVMALLAEHAPGWQFCLRMTCDPETQAETPLYKSGDGTAWIQGYFRAPKGSHFDDTPELVFPVMNHKNDAIKFEEVSARDLSDADRRCRCAAAAAFFRLGWQLWTKDPIENPFREEVELAPEPKQSRAARPKKASPTNNQPTQADSVAKAEEPSLKDQVQVIIRPLFQDAGGMAAINEWRAQYKQQFNPSVEETLLTGEHIQTQEQFDWTKTFLDDIIKRKSNPQ